MLSNYETEIEINDEPVEVVCEYEYEAACGDGWNEPRYPEQVNIYSVKADGVEIDFTDYEDFLMDEIMEDLNQL